MNRQTLLINDADFTLPGDDDHLAEYANGVLDGIEYWLETRCSTGARIESVLMRDGW